MVYLIGFSSREEGTGEVIGFFSEDGSGIPTCYYSLSACKEDVEKLNSGVDEDAKPFEHFAVTVHKVEDA